MKITKEILDEAVRLAPEIKIERTNFSVGNNDKIVGNIAEMIWAQYSLGDWRINTVGKNKGEIDFGEVEIKGSVHPFSRRLNLCARLDYTKSRKPQFYVQVLIISDVPRPKEIKVGWEAVIIGYATCEEVDQAGIIEFKSPTGSYQCKAVPFTSLHSIGPHGKEFT